MLPTAANRLQRAFEAVFEANRIDVPGLEHAGAGEISRLDHMRQAVLAGDVEVKLVDDVDGRFPDSILISARDVQRIGDSRRNQSQPRSHDGAAAGKHGDEDRRPGDSHE
jgi:hypothetical protein